MRFAAPSLAVAHDGAWLALHYPFKHRSHALLEKVRVVFWLIQNAVKVVCFEDLILFDYFDSLVRVFFFDKKELFFSEFATAARSHFVLPSDPQERKNRVAWTSKSTELDLQKREYFFTLGGGASASWEDLGWLLKSDLVGAGVRNISGEFVRVDARDSTGLTELKHTRACDIFKFN